RAPANGVGGEEWRVVGSADADHAAIGLNDVNAVRKGQTLGLGTEVMVLNQNRCPAPQPTVVLEVAHQLFLLGVDADNRIAAAAELLPVRAEVAELLVAVGTAVGTTTFAVGVQGVVQLAQ